MALFKSLRGKRENLPSSKTDGYAYFCTDDGTFWIDYTDDSGIVQRKQINAKDAETIMGHTVEIDVPSNAKFTDTTYDAAGTSLGLVKTGGDATIIGGVITIAELDSKVNVETGKGLSTNDLTDVLKENYDTAYIHSQQPHNYAGSWNKKKSRKTIKDLLPKSIIKMIYIIGQKTWARNKYSWFQIPFDR